MLLILWHVATSTRSNAERDERTVLPVSSLVCFVHCLFTPLMWSSMFTWLSIHLVHLGSIAVPLFTSKFVKVHWQLNTNLTLGGAPLWEEILLEVRSID